MTPAARSTTGAPRRPSDGDRSPAAALLGDRELELLALLAAGLTDGAVAARLGVSERTVRRTLAATMLRLGARSRFQAGLIAARLGLPAPATVCPCAATCHRGRRQPAPCLGHRPAGGRLRG